MEELWKAGLIGLLVYGNYKLFKGHVWSVFWALCYNVLSREVKKSHPLIMRPVLLGISMFPVLAAMVLPSVLVFACMDELVSYFRHLLETVRGDPSLGQKLNGLVPLLLKQVIRYLEIRKEEKISEPLVLAKIVEKAEKYAEEILSGSRMAFETIGQFVFFLSMVGFFSRMEKPPLFYVVRPIPKAEEITRIFENIVHSLCASSLFNFLCGSGLAFATNSPLVITEGVLSAFLSIFPIVPCFLYCVPSLVYLLAQKSYGMFGMFLTGAVLQQMLALKMYEFTFRGGSFRSLSIALGLSVFGLPGAILGPFLVSSLMVLWLPEDESSTPSAKAPAKLKPLRTVRVSTTGLSKSPKTMDILRKTK
ncbi:hypothetical protein NECID01_0441 [Nematocida sp. AWRm77]|nr:hypothetical protein NECID01_0441 [Nematocida sp. AWRm77]